MPENQSGSLNPTPPYAHHVIPLPSRSKTQHPFNSMKHPSISSNPAPTPPSTSPISSTRLTSTSQAPQTVLTNLSPFGNKILRTHRQTVPHYWLLCGYIPGNLLNVVRSNPKKFKSEDALLHFILSLAKTTVLAILHTKKIADLQRFALQYPQA